MRTEQPDHLAASCADAPGICRELDPQTSCGFVCLERDEAGNCTDRGWPSTPFCTYYSDDESWFSLDPEEQEPGLFDEPAGA